MNYAELDPGVREFVRELQERGYRTTDSGDGRTKHPTCRVMAGAHIILVCAKSEVEAVMQEVIDLAEASDEWRYDFNVSCSYAAGDESVTVSLVEWSPEVIDAQMEGVTHLASENYRGALVCAQEEAERALGVLFAMGHYNLQESRPPWMSLRSWSRHLGLGSGDDE